jgi:hypothetical protein
VSRSLTTVVGLVTVLHVAAFVVMVMIRLRRDEADGTTAERAKIRQCAVCSEPRSYSTDLAHYQPLCASH